LESLPHHFLRLFPDSKESLEEETCFFSKLFVVLTPPNSACCAQPSLAPAVVLPFMIGDTGTAAIFLDQ